MNGAHGLTAPPIAANADPETSHLAAAEITRTGSRRRQSEAVLALVELFPCFTSAELGATDAAKRKGLDRYDIAKRLSDLKTLGLVAPLPKTKCEITGRLALVWDIVKGADRGQMMLLEDPAALALKPRRTSKKRADAMRLALDHIADLATAFEDMEMDRPTFLSRVRHWVEAGLEP